MMQEQLSKVREFHLAIGEKVAELTELLETDNRSDQALAIGLRELINKTRARRRRGSRLNRRALMAIEELAEWIEAHIAGNMVEAADALADRLYVLLGDAVATGLPLEQIFDEVHRSNMTKRGSNAETGKGRKTNDFDLPHFEAILNKPDSSRQIS